MLCPRALAVYSRLTLPSSTNKRTIKDRRKKGGEWNGFRYGFKPTARAKIGERVRFIRSEKKKSGTRMRYKTCLGPTS